jgi:hypothetical protein
MRFASVSKKNKKNFKLKLKLWKLHWKLPLPHPNQEQLNTMAELNPCPSNFENVSLFTLIVIVCPPESGERRLPCKVINDPEL